MPISQFSIKFTSEERALLRKQAAKRGLSEADCLRVCLVVDSVMDGDPLAVKITVGRVRDLARRRMSELFGLGLQTKVLAKG